MTTPASLAQSQRPAGLSAGMTFLMAAACGLIAANLYYTQPLAGPIALDIGLPAEATGLIVTVTQIGYGLGLLLLVPLGDLLENRRLIVTMISLVTLALIAAGLSTTPEPFLTASLAIGLGSVAVQMIVPFAANLAPDAVRGRVVGNIMSGLMVGIMMARPIAGLIAGVSSWHTVFYVSAIVMVGLGALLWTQLPTRMPAAGRLSYGQLLKSMAQLLATQPVLQRRAAYQACQFAAFSLFWTVTPLYLAGPSFGLGHNGIALFALAGVAGAVASPIAGRLSDKGLVLPATAFGLVSVAAAFLMTQISEGSTFALTFLTLAAILLDFGVTMTLVTGQRSIYELGADLRSRLNGLFMAIFFTGGAIGSALGAWAFASGGWWLASMIGLALPATAFAIFLTETRTERCSES
ncbi:MFS transporter [Ensifer adhaerens]|jgi:predicted MFS family arabinose efflux permease|uniref:MFS transporter n=1 Tax=Ensifer adhaerens TaxID=106592 RepID=UPI000DD85AA7|nr:MFS transporter [Ensifer adhaerens]QHG74088.1 MFS transporter [Ensifer adhaerens]